MGAEFAATIEALNDRIFVVEAISEMIVMMSDTASIPRRGPRSPERFGELDSHGIGFFLDLAQKIEGLLAGIGEIVAL